MRYCPTCREITEDGEPGLVSLHHVSSDPPSHHTGAAHEPDHDNDVAWPPE